MRESDRITLNKTLDSVARLRHENQQLRQKLEDVEWADRVEYSIPLCDGSLDFETLREAHEEYSQ